MIDELKEYISKWLDYWRKKNVLRMYDSNAPVLVPGVLKKAVTAEDWAKLQKELDDATKQYKLDSTALSNYLIEYPEEISLGELYNNDDLYLDLSNRYVQSALEKYKASRNYKNGLISNGGSNCIWNATAGLHPIARVADLRANPSKYGMKLVSRDYQFPHIEEMGDIVLFPKDRGSHASVATHDGKYNWSSGGADESDLILDGTNLLNASGAIYRFVGTPQDSAMIILHYYNGDPVPEIEVKPKRKGRNSESNPDDLINSEYDKLIHDAFEKRYARDYIAPWDFVTPITNSTPSVSFSYPLVINKKGGKIHIKKSHKGRFTDYCGGKVTEECIRRGKNSSSASVRKQATFAENARHWKH